MNSQDTVTVLRHDTLETITITSSSSTLLRWGPALGLDKPTIATGLTSTTKRDGQVPYLRVGPSDKFCVRVWHYSPTCAASVAVIEEIKLAVLALRQEFICFYCGEVVPWGMQEMEHVVPRSKGGPDCAENMVMSCRRCNRKVRDWSLIKKVEYRDQKIGQKKEQNKGQKRSAA